MLQAAWGPAVALPDTGQASAEAREVTARSALHQLDLRLRQAMGRAVALLRAGDGGDVVVSGAAKHLSEARRALLGRARAHLGTGDMVVWEAEFAETCVDLMCTWPSHSL